MDDPLIRFRDRFPILEKTTYLVSHSLGAMPRSVRGQLHDYAEAWDMRGVRAWEEGWWELPVTVGDVLAPLVGAPQGSMAMLPNVSLAELVVASCFSFSPPRNRVVVCDLDFPSVQYVWHAVPGAEVVTVSGRGGISIETEELLEAVDERTAVVAVSHVLFKSAHILDVGAITNRAHQVGARVVLDCYHSAGILPFSLTELKVDFAVGGSVKWLCGGPGAGWLYVRPDHHGVLEPWAVGWQADREPFAFRPGPIEHAEGIWRFLNGTPGVPGLYAARAGYEIVAEAGVAEIRRKSLHMTQWLIDMAEELEIPVSSELDPERRAGTVTLGLPDEARLAAALGEAKVIVDSRPGAGIRVGPHFYNSEDDLLKLRKELIALLG